MWISYNVEPFMVLVQQYVMEMVVMTTRTLERDTNHKTIYNHKNNL